jgi:hypothetical protein
MTETPGRALPLIVAVSREASLGSGSASSGGFFFPSRRKGFRRQTL